MTHTKKTASEVKIAASRPRPAPPEQPMPPTILFVVAFALGVLAVVIGTALPKFEGCAADICSMEMEDLQ